MPDGVAVIRMARRADLPQLVQLCAAHAVFEGGVVEGEGLHQRLEAALFGAGPQLWAWVLETCGRVQGYVTAFEGFSTWSGRAYLEMDCLFLKEDVRGAGHGRDLMDAVMVFARNHGFAEVQWQTPDWNAAAIGFYNRKGAQRRAKLRFSLAP